MSEEQHDSAMPYLRDAQRGDLGAQGWLIQYFSPALVATARKRLAGQPSVVQDAEDLIQDVWSVFLNRLHDLKVTEDRCSPLIMRFLSRTLAQLIVNLIRKRRRRGSVGGNESPVSSLPSHASGIVTKVVRGERSALLIAAMEDMADDDREVLQLRALDQLGPNETGKLLGLTPNAVSARYSRAIKRIRDQIPGTVFDALPSE